MTMHSNDFNVFIDGGAVLDRTIDECADSITSVRERPMALITFKPEPRERKRKKGFGEAPVNVGYHRLERLAAAPGMRDWYEDKTSQWAKPLSMDERRRGGK